MRRPTNFRLDDGDVSAWREEAERADLDLTALVEQATNSFTAADGRRAHQAVAAALAAGELTRQPCEVCGDGKVEAHHDDYAKPLEVRWLCRTHHRRWHKDHPSGIKWDHFNIRLDDETKARWIAMAAERGYQHLAEFVKACVEAKISGAVLPRRRPASESKPTPIPTPTPPPPVRDTPVQPAAAGKRSYEPDFKKEPKR